MTRVLISGASIAGPSAAYWLNRYGCEVTIVEKFEGVRTGGQAVDFKGPIHHEVLTRMGILQAVKDADVPNDDGIIVNARGRKIGSIPGEFAGGEINIPRGDLANIIYSLTKDRCRYIFNDSVTSLKETDSGVEVTFARAPSEEFDFVIGADGMHSNVRSLAFGPESDYVEHRGYYYALVQLDTGSDDMMYNEPGRMAAIGGLKSPAFFVFASDPLPDARDDVEVQKQQLIEAYSGSHWRIPELMMQIPQADDFYLDSISRVNLKNYSRGRTVLLGDSAYGNALGGFGTGLAMVAAYVLAGEVAKSEGDHRKAFEEYEKKIKSYAATSQKVNAGRLLAPRTNAGIKVRNLLFTSLSLVGPLMKVVDKPASNIDLVDYPEIISKIQAPVIARQ